MFNVAQQRLHDTDVNPRHVHANICRQLLQERDEWWGTMRITKSMRIFGQEVESLDTPCIFAPPDSFTHQGNQQPMESGEFSRGDEVQAHEGKGAMEREHADVHGSG